MPVEIPQDLKDLASRLGLDVEALLTQAEAGKPAPGADALPAIPQAQAQAVGAGGAAAAAPSGAAVISSEGETEVQKLQRELAVSQQETQQVRKLAQTADEGRVVGSGGLGSGNAEVPVPNLGGIDPGLRWAVRNGLIEVEKLAPAIAELFKADLGGVI